MAKWSKNIGGKYVGISCPHFFVVGTVVEQTTMEGPESGAADT